MNKQEFTDRTGLHPTDEEYKTIEAMYMATGNMDKDNFCRQYKKIDSLSLELFKTTQILKGELEEANNIIADLHTQKITLIFTLIQLSEKYSAPDLREIVINEIGARVYLKKKVQMGYSLWDCDKQLLIELLSK